MINMSMHDKHKFLSPYPSNLIYYKKKHSTDSPIETHMYVSFSISLHFPFFSPIRVKTNLQGD